MQIVRSLRAALAAGVFAAGAVAGPAWADRGFDHHRHGSYRQGHHRHGDGAWALGVGLVAGTAFALAMAEPRPVYRPPVVIHPPPVVHVPPRVVMAPVVVAPPVYVEQSWWYYCSAPAGYYPYVAACPSGWSRVAPLP